MPGPGRSLFRRLRRGEGMGFTLVRLFACVIVIVLCIHSYPRLGNLNVEPVLVCFFV
jgi:hypothetical protein